jgi:hypothetical protein
MVQKFNAYVLWYTLLIHRCTVVGNPGGDPWDFWQILLRGVLGVVRKLEVVFIAFL